MAVIHPIPQGALKAPEPEPEPEVIDDGRPEGASAAHWTAYCSPACARVMRCVSSTEARGTGEIAREAGYCRTTTGRILHVAELLGDVTRERRRVWRTHGDFWRATA